MAARVVVSFEGAIVMEMTLAKPVTVVGRHPDCDIFINDPAVSTRHMLFRLVDHTVYAEDLASTNGTLVNGIVVSSQVVHHLDLIEVGRHKLHFFDDSLLPGAVSNLETTVTTGYERTFVSEFAEAGAAEPASDDLSQTLAIRREAGGGFTVASPPERPSPQEGTRFALRVLDGEERGRVITLDKAHTMIGDPGEDTALVIKRGPALFLVRFAGRHPPRVNRDALGAGHRELTEHDIIEVGPAAFEVIHWDGRMLPPDDASRA